MNCPIDNSELKITERQGIEIDYCPQCRGVWLDRGELDKIIERTNTMMGDVEQQKPLRDDSHQSRKGDLYYGDREYSYDDRKKKKKSFFDDLFDF